MKRILIVCLFGLAGFTSCKKEKKSAIQPPDNTSIPQNTFHWQLYTQTNSQLSNNQVNAIAISKADVKWIGTANGLVRIEGNNWTIYNEYNSPLPSSTIQALAVQNNGTVWIGTNKGAVKFDGINWQTYTPENSLLLDKAIMSIAHDGIYNRTWLGTAKGLVEIKEDNSWHLHDETEGELPLSLATDHDGALWMGCHDHLNFRGKVKRFQFDKWSTYQLDRMGFESAFPYAIGVDKNNAIVAVLTGTAVQSVIRLNDGTWNELNRPENLHGMRSLALEGEKIWVGGTSLALLGEVLSAALPITGTDAGILAMAVDSKGNKWIGTAGGGLAVYHE